MADEDRDERGDSEMTPSGEQQILSEIRRGEENWFRELASLAAAPEGSAAAG